MDLLIAISLVALLLVTLASGLWVGLALVGVGVIAMELFTPRAAGDAMALTIWGATSGWTMVALPMFLWMGEILFRTKVIDNVFRGVAPWADMIPGRLLHVNVFSCAIFAAVSGSSAATCATVGRMVVPELHKRGYPERLMVGTLAGSASLGLLIPPSVIMIVYGVAADVSIVKLFIAGIIPGLVLTLAFSGYVMGWAMLNPAQVPSAGFRMSLSEKIRGSAGLLPVILLIATVMGSIYMGIATATEAAIIGVVGALLLSALDGTLTYRSFCDGLMSSVRVYCMIGLILAGAAFLTLVMGFVGLPRQVAELIGSANLPPFALIMMLTVFFIVLGCFLDGISMVILTIAILLPTIQQAGIDLIWFGVYIVLVVELAQITPPVGMNLFVIQNITGVSIGRVAKASMPMFAIILGFLLLSYAVPGLVTWLPSHI
ncbi:TRAP transporter large permease [Salipiger sp. PrR002]|uniref:TRAP transporter large permease n=1 Tax=Salipiger sp. PrR002 TaxID=2706489 RepID=UPI0013BCE17E|nr:TRAP transporter large permease subunit [Salipiger sp. PrR002]NDW00213.1 TRAP transporter large permease subunit [Salipiger sp. PrR002]NDW56778.1 TRAP transporter large permease subunit [Salipiger sp. PrR004]